MVDGIAGGGRGRIDAARTAAQQTAGRVLKPVMAKPIARLDGGQGADAARLDPQVESPVARANGTRETTAARVAGGSAPIDAARVSAIRTAIAEGRYPVDPQKIAARMLELDLSPLK